MHVAATFSYILPVIIANSFILGYSLFSSLPLQNEIKHVLHLESPPLPPHTRPTINAHPQPRHVLSFLQQKQPLPLSHHQLNGPSSLRPGFLPWRRYVHVHHPLQIRVCPLHNRKLLQSRLRLWSTAKGQIKRFRQHRWNSTILHQSITTLLHNSRDINTLLRITNRSLHTSRRRESLYCHSHISDE